MTLALYKLLPEQRGLVLLTTTIIENLTARLPSVKEFQEELKVEFVDREIIGKAIKLGEKIVLQGLVRKKIKREQAKRSSVLSENSLVSDITDDALLEKYNQEKKRVIPESIYLNNRVEFIENIRRKMLKLRFKKDDATCESKDTKEFEPLTHQMIVTRYLNSYTPYRGLLLYHGLGSGKTCSSISIMEGMKNTHRVFIMTPASLQANYRTQMKFCGDQLFKTNHNWVFEEYQDRPGPLIKAFYELTGITEEYFKSQREIESFIKSQHGVWMIRPDEQPNFDQLSEEQQGIIETQIDLMIKSKYNYINYNGINAKRWTRDYTQGGTVNPFDNSVLIIDEVHNFVSRIQNKLNIKKTSVSTEIYEAIMMAENCKVVPLTGTPYINYPCELGVLFNLIGGYTFALEITLNVMDTKINEEYFKHLLNMPFIDILEYDRPRSKLTLVQNPYGFKKESDGKMIYDEDTMTRVEFHDTIIDILQKDKKYSIQHVEMQKYKKMPDTDVDFNNYFVTPDLKINNKEWFQSKIIGMVSYLGDKSELMPEIVKAPDGSDIHIVNVNMSPHQIKAYSIIRKEERKTEKIKKGVQTEEPNSTYKVFSRSCCNFAFPLELPRPLPSIKKLTEEDVDALLNEELLEDVDGKFDESDIEDRKIDKDYQRRIDKVLDEMNKNPHLYFNSEIPKLVDVEERGDTSALDKYSPKMKEVLRNVINDEHIGCHLLYSNFRRLEGIGIFSIILKYYGFVQLKVERTSNGYSIVLDHPYDRGVYLGNKKVFALYTGTENNEQKEIIRNIFNSNFDALPNNIVSQLAIYFPENKDKNSYGEIIKLLMITASGAEGIDLKNTRFVHIMEPYWHHVRINQVIGRARRICSHAGLPEEYRDVTIYLYMARFNKEVDLDEYISLKTLDGSKTTDETLFDIMERKRGLSKMFLDTLKEASIDCIVNYKDKCVQHPFTKRADKLITGIEYKKEPLKKLQVEGSKIPLFKKLVMTDGQLVKYAVDTSVFPEKLYDYEKFKENIPVHVGYIEDNVADLF
jgi:hypothetical protein